MAALLDASATTGAAPAGPASSRRGPWRCWPRSRPSLGTHTVMVHDLMDELMEALSPWRDRVRFTNLRAPAEARRRTRVFVPALRVAHGLTQAVTEAMSQTAHQHSGSAITTVTIESDVPRRAPIDPEGFYLRFTISDNGRGFNYPRRAEPQARCARVHRGERGLHRRGGPPGHRPGPRHPGGPRVAQGRGEHLARSPARSSPTASWGSSSWPRSAPFVTRCVASRTRPPGGRCSFPSRRTRCPG
ncbi:hypothetical protein QJS66_17590 [Kocuria rhizophila]|nr:hypothetical protein QJS66_17590 [Kocuria rhizophila]